MKNLVKSVFESLLGRRNLWLFGRSLYLKARAETLNEPDVNGESMVQHQMLQHFSDTKESLVVFDVGANVGAWTLSLLRDARQMGMDRQLEIHSFEPVPSTFSVLRGNIQTSGLDHAVRLVPLALSDAEGEADMYISGETAGTNSMHPDGMDSRQRSIRIDKTTASAYRAGNDIPVVHFLKCDAEGHDMEVIRGAKALFDESSIMALQFEYNIRWVYSRHFLKDVFDLLEGSAYRIGKITPRHIELYEAWHPELERFWEGNYLILHPEALNWFPSISGGFDEYFVYNGKPVK